MKWAPMQFFAPDNHFTDGTGSGTGAGRAELIGNGCDQLIPARHPPREAIEVPAPAGERGGP